jgi:hypothetical protein
LPTTFRFAPNAVIPDAVKKLCQTIPFVNRAFMLDIEKTVLRRNPEYKDLHKYLVAETEAVVPFALIIIGKCIQTRSCEYDSSIIFKC